MLPLQLQKMRERFDDMRERSSWATISRSRRVYLPVPNGAERVEPGTLANTDEYLIYDALPQ